METPQIDAIKETARAAVQAAEPKTVHIPAYNARTRQTETRELVIRSGKEGNSFKRITLILSFILIELAFLAVLYAQFIIAFLWFLFIPYGIGVIFACRVAVGNKNPDSKIAWILFLLILAPAAVYLLAGEISASPIKARRLKRINAETKFLQKTELPEGLPPRVKQDCNLIQNTSDFTPFFNGAAAYFPTGEAFFEDVLTELQRAEQFIFMDFFIIAEGRLSNAIFKILIEKARTGVDVRVIVDGLGSHNTLSLPKVKRIRKYGVKIIAFEPVLPLVNFFVHYRDHRKIIVIDGRTGYVGGANIADEYVNAKERFGVWKDASLRIDGGAVKSLTLIFLRMWAYSSKEKPDYARFIDQSAASAGFRESGSGQLILPYGDGVNDGSALGKAVYCNIINNARETIYIMTPYFVADGGILDMLKAKAQSGVDVRLVLPGVPDKKIVYALTRSNAERLVSGGVRVYTYTPGFLHSKVMLSDGECAVVGSVNMDFRSFYQQYESAAYLGGGTAIKSVAADFENTFALSKEIRLADIKKRGIFARTGLAFIRLFAPLM
ncbi:MAG: cardiolipin synthase [Firmicutes bacterium]|nr:cardiolipin synthase [Bacillota bacterium]